MAREKFVVRLLDREHQLLAWAEVYAEPRPQERGASCPFWPVTPTKFLIEQSGQATAISVHWCDLDVARLTSIVEAVSVEAYQVFDYAWIEPIWLVPGMRDVPLPAVTVRAPVTVPVPTGALMADA